MLLDPKDNTCPVWCRWYAPYPHVKFVGEEVGIISYLVPVQDLLDVLRELPEVLKLEISSDDLMHDRHCHLVSSIFQVSQL